MQEWDAGMEPVFTSVTRGTFPTVKAGRVKLSDRPGLGLEMDWSELDRHFAYRGPSMRPPGGK